jgi:molecular chaperone GrpE
VAEYRNLQVQTKREVQAAKDFALQRFAKDLIESIDTFDLALSAVPAEKIVKATEGAEDSNKDLRELHGGLRMTETVLLNTLRKHGLERFDPSPESEKFNPNMHEAMFQTPMPDKEDGTCFHTTQKGFTLNGRILRVSILRIADVAIC